MDENDTDESKLTIELEEEVVEEGKTTEEPLDNSSDLAV